MDLSTNSIGWHRTRRWLDDEIESARKRYNENLEDPEQIGGDFSLGMLAGMEMAYSRIRQRFNTPEENALVEQTRREMFG